MKGASPIHRYFLNHFDPVMGALGGAFLFVFVFLAKYPDGIKLAAIAGGKQFVFNFLMGGVMMKACENLAVTISPRGRALLLAVLVPSVINVSITYLIHLSDDGDVHPIRSTIPTMIFAPSAYVWWSRLKRKKASTNRLADPPVL